MTHRWLVLPEVCALSGITKQSISEAIQRTLTDAFYQWRGARLVVRQRHGRGGHAGKQYEVHVDSLPLELQERLKALRTAALAPAKADDAGEVERRFRLILIEPALAHPRYSQERAAAVRRAASVPHNHPARGRETYSVRTLQLWITKHEQLGPGAVTRRRRSDVGKSTVFVTALWDGSVPFTDEQKAEVRDLIRQHLRNLWGRGAAYSVVRRLGGDKLARLTGERGHKPGKAELARICILPKNLVENERWVRCAHERRTDRKSHDDKRPRIRRTIAGTAPMQLVIADVHHIDVLVRRPDGSTATPKLIAWMDVATHRLRSDVVFCDPGRGITNADLIESFCRMVADPEWGLPAGLYVDNGSEFNFAEFVEDALRLRNLQLYGSAVKRSTPYQGASKGRLEGAFRILQQQGFATIAGFIGGDRLNSKSASLGRPQPPFEDGYDAFRKVVQTRLDYYNTNEQRGDLRGRTPDSVFREFVRKNWERIDFKVDELAMVFAKAETRRVKKGVISIALPGFGSRVYFHDDLHKHDGAEVTVYLPKYRAAHGAPVYTSKGERIGVAFPDRTYGHDDPTGAQEARRRAQSNDRHVRSIAKSLQPIDIDAEMAASAAERMGTEQPRRGGTVSLGPGIALDAHDAEPAHQEELRDRAHEANQEKLRRQLVRDEAMRRCIPMEPS